MNEARPSIEIVPAIVRGFATRPRRLCGPWHTQSSLAAVLSSYCMVWTRTNPACEPYAVEERNPRNHRTSQRILIGRRMKKVPR